MFLTLKNADIFSRSCVMLSPIPRSYCAALIFNIALGQGPRAMSTMWAVTSGYNVQSHDMKRAFSLEEKF